MVEAAARLTCEVPLDGEPAGLLVGEVDWLHFQAGAARLGNAVVFARQTKLTLVRSTATDRWEAQATSR